MDVCMTLLIREWLCRPPRHRLPPKVPSRPEVSAGPSASRLNASSQSSQQTAPPSLVSLRTNSNFDLELV